MDDTEASRSTLDSLPFARLKQERELVAGCPLTTRERTEVPARYVQPGLKLARTGSMASCLRRAANVAALT